MAVNFAILKYRRKHFHEGVTPCEVNKMRVEPKFHSPPMMWLHRNASTSIRKFACLKEIKNILIIFTYHLTKICPLSSILTQLLKDPWNYVNNPIENDKTFLLKNLDNILKNLLHKLSFSKEPFIWIPTFFLNSRKPSIEHLLGHAFKQGLPIHVGLQYLIILKVTWTLSYK